VAVWQVARTITGAEMRARVGALEAHPGGYTNVSHTHGLTVLAHAPVRVGIDVELVRDRPYLDRVARRAMTDTEWEQWRASTDPVRAFAQHWTRVEAYLKGIGAGVRGGLRSRPTEGWTVADLDVGAMHAGALAVQTGGRELRVHRRS